MNVEEASNKLNKLAIELAPKYRLDFRMVLGQPYILVAYIDLMNSVPIAVGECEDTTLRNLLKARIKKGLFELKEKIENDLKEIDNV